MKIVAIEAFRHHPKVVKEAWVEDEYVWPCPSYKICPAQESWSLRAVPGSVGSMCTILYQLFHGVLSGFRSHADLQLEVITLRHQLAVLRRNQRTRVRLTRLDRSFWILLYRLWPSCLDALVIVEPATVIRWHRKGFRAFWSWKSRRRGRPPIAVDIRNLIRRMSRENPLWGAPRIHGELLKLGIAISQAVVSK